MSFYRVLGDIAYEKDRDTAGRPVHATAVKGEVVFLTAKDAVALLARGDVTFDHDRSTEIADAEFSELPPPKSLPPHED